MYEIYPSLISADILNLKGSIDQLDDLCHGYHLDIMDNHFVPNLTWGAQFMNAIAQYGEKPVWVHLMIEKPEEFLDRLFVPDNTYITFHIETKSNIKNVITGIREKKWRPSIAINPKTDVEESFAYLEHVHQILLMSVDPGFSGQQFIPDVLKKIAPLQHELEIQNLVV